MIMEVIKPDKTIKIMFNENDVHHLVLVIDKFLDGREDKENTAINACCQRLKHIFACFKSGDLDDCD